MARPEAMRRDASRKSARSGPTSRTIRSGPSEQPRATSRKPVEKGPETHRGTPPAGRPPVAKTVKPAKTSKGKQRPQLHRGAKRGPARMRPIPPRRLRPVVKLGNPSRRLRFALAVIVLLFALLGGRLIQLQFTDGKTYAALAAEQRTAKVSVVAPRGAILDRDGNPLAHSVPASAVYADPKFVKDPQKTARQLAAIIGIPESTLVKKLGTKKNDKGTSIRFSYLARALNPEVGAEVKKLNVAGVYVLPEQRRDVPGHDLAANVIGFTGTDGYGLGGLEASFEHVLGGKDGTSEFEVGGRGQIIPDGYKKKTPAQPGSDLRLTLDSDLQYQTQRMLTESLHKVNAFNGSAIIMDAHTGNIVAMASYPTYDAANPISSSSVVRGNLATSSVIEPGSVHKAITYGAAFEEGVISADTVLTVPPTIKKGGKTFTDTHSHPTTGMTISGMLAQSSNVGTIMIADELGRDRLYEYQKKFGLGKKTNLGLPGESNGIVQPPKNWSGPSDGGIPIGLGVAVTPLQMTSVYATIANGGERVQPRLIDSVIGPDGTVQKRISDKPTRVMSENNAAALREALEAVPTKEGTAPKAAVPGYRVAGKTGTGMRVEDNKYAEGEVASFIGMVPADAPRYVIGVFAHIPQGTGGAITGPIFSDLASFTLRHYAIAPSGAPAPPIRIYA